MIVVKVIFPLRLLNCFNIIFFHIIYYKTLRFLLKNSSCLFAQEKTLIHEDLAMNWFVQLCLAVKHLHSLKILHRDLKTQVT